MALLLLCGCSHIDESERFIYVKPAAVKRTVLIEEFTGQRCVNCPEAALEVESLQAQYGEENIIAVGIHSGPLAVFSAGEVVGLRTQLGDDYYNHYEVEMEPTAMINRRGGVVRRDKWASMIYSELQAETPLQLSVDYNRKSAVQIDATVEAVVAEAVKGKLQLWLVEDSIIAPQMMPDGTMNSQYVHRHVLRSAINGTWGDDVDWKQGHLPLLRYTFSIDSQWHLEQLSIVAFVYTDNGVQQVCQKKLSE